MSELTSDLLYEINCFLCHLGDLVELLIIYKISLYHPAATAGCDLSE